MNTLYSWARNQFLTGQLNWLTDTFKVVLVDTSIYKVLPTVHQHLVDIPGTAQVAISSALTGTAAAGGTATANDVNVPAVFGAIIEALVIFHDTGDPTTSDLIAYLDTASGLPFNPQGSDVNVVWDTGPNGIFTL